MKAEITAHKSRGSQGSARLSTAGSSSQTLHLTPPHRIDSTARIVKPGNFSVSAVATNVALSSASVAPEALPELFFLLLVILSRSVPAPSSAGVPPWLSPSVVDDTWPGVIGGRLSRANTKTYIDTNGSETNDPTIQNMTPENVRESVRDIQLTSRQSFLRETSR